MALLVETLSWSRTRKKKRDITIDSTIAATNKAHAPLTAQQQCMGVESSLAAEHERTVHTLSCRKEWLIAV